VSRCSAYLWRGRTVGCNGWWPSILTPAIGTQRWPSITTNDFGTSGWS